MADQNILNRLASGPATSGIVNTFSNARLAGEQIASAQHDRQMNTLAAQQAQEDRQRALAQQEQERLAEAIAQVEVVRQTRGDAAASALWDFNAQRLGRPDQVGRYSPEAVQGIAMSILGREQIGKRLNPEPVTLGQNQVLSDPSTGKTIASGPRQPHVLKPGESLVTPGSGVTALAPRGGFGSQGSPIAPGQELTPGQKKVDEEFAKEWQEFKASGGVADVQKNLAQLESVAAELEGDVNLTGRLVGRLPDVLRSEKSISVRDRVEEVVQRNLRLILGAQFTQEEGARLIARAFNENLSEAENLRRVNALIGQIRGAAQAKVAAGEYFDRFGTLVGFEGAVPNLSDAGASAPGGVINFNSLPD